jgi:hypothetical protein
VIRYSKAASGQLVKDAASLRPESCSGIEIPGDPLGIRDDAIRR